MSLERDSCTTTTTDNEFGEGFLELWGGISTNEFGEGFLILLELMSLDRDSCTTTTADEFGEGFLELWGGSLERAF